MEFLNQLINFLKTNLNSIINEIDLINLSISISLFFIILIFKNVIKLILKKKIRFLSSLKNKRSKELSESFDSLFTFFVYFLAFFIFTISINTSEKTGIFFEKINLSLFTILTFWIIQQSVEPIILGIKNVRKILTTDLLEWVTKALKIIIFILGFSAVLELWGIKVGAIIAGLGLFGVAVALGAQDLFKNLISGILVLVEKRFKKGDVIIIENIIEGSVEKIGFRSTAIRKFDKSICYIPNFQFAENAVTNISETTYRRINWIIGLEYKSSVNQLKKICKDIENYVSKNSKDFKVTNAIPVIVKIDEFADSSINILVRCFTNTKDYNEYLDIKDRFAIELKNIVDRRKGSFAFPSQSIYIEKNS
tara:strand:+ start:1927 stop:3021 length:1095 start_codon:yes stop_codon:yes gene_type:complete